MAEISFRNVTKRYGETLALDDASFTVADNEFFCFFGPPLSGKSTILRLILGLERPDEGEVLIDGKRVNEVSPAARNVAMVFQNLALFPHMSARENVAFPLIERSVAKGEIDRKIAEVSEKLHIGHILHKPPAQLSGGERQRVAIARALVRDPVAYLMDDPISALDARLREETRVELKRIQRELGKTLIYVTHDQEEAMSVADRMAILEEGTLRQIGSPVEIYDSPSSIYVAGLLGSPAMNILDARREGSDLYLAEGAIRFPASSVPKGAARIGLRPENLHVTPLGSGAGDVVAEEVEPLGGYTVVTVSTGRTRMRALLRGQPKITPATPVTLSCDLDKLHYFGAGGGALA